MPFVCSICEEAANQICARCTKDVCGNHLCEKCLRCSDCCECEVTLTEPVPQPAAAPLPQEAAADPAPELEAPFLLPDAELAPPGEGDPESVVP